MKSLFLLAFLGTFITPLAAQTPVKLPPLPAGPLPAHLDRAQWTVVIQPDPGDATNAGKAADKTMVTIAKDKDVREITIQEPGGAPIVYWCLHGVQYTTQRDGSWASVDPTSDTLIASYKNTDFPECQCVQPGNYHAVSKVNGRPCFVFSGSVSTVSREYLQQLKADADPGQKVSEESFQGSNSVNLDMATVLPLSTHFKDHLYFYQYSADAPSVTPPPTLLLMLKNQQHLIDDLNRTPAHA